ncbi:hypothetical protein BH09MYX1_BH09MYX1_63920 [soil metagenome]
MTICYGLGFARHHIDDDVPRPRALLILRALARAAQVTITEAVGDGVVTIDPSGHVDEVDDGDRTREILEALQREGGSVPASSFDHLGGFCICVPGAVKAASVYLPSGSESHVSPLADFRDHLDELLGRVDIAPECERLHRSFRALCDLSERLRVPLVVLGR